MNNPLYHQIVEASVYCHKLRCYGSDPIATYRLPLPRYAVVNVDISPRGWLAAPPGLYAARWGCFGKDGLVIYASFIYAVR